VGIFAYLFWMSNHYENTKPVNNATTESNLMVIPQNKEYDLCFLGASTARVLSRNGNHDRVEKILNKSIINLAQGGGRGGVEKNYIFFSYFLEQGNNVKQLIYFLPPQCLFTDSYDNLKMDIEPFKFSFLKHGIKNKMDIATLFNYIQTKFTSGWKSVILSQEQNHSLEKIDTVAIGKNLANFTRYEKQSPAEFTEKFEYLKKIVALAKEHDAKVSIIFQAHLMNEFPHLSEVKNELKKQYDQKEIDIVDLSDSLKEPSYFYDHLHLNTKGAVEFTKKFLK